MISEELKSKHFSWFLTIKWKFQRFHNLPLSTDFSVKNTHSWSVYGLYREWPTILRIYSLLLLCSDDFTYLLGCILVNKSFVLTRVNTVSILRLGKLLRISTVYQMKIYTWKYYIRWETKFSSSCKIKTRPTKSTTKNS